MVPAGQVDALTRAISVRESPQSAHICNHRLVLRRGMFSVSRSREKLCYYNSRINLSSAKGHLTKCESPPMAVQHVAQGKSRQILAQMRA